MEKTEVQIFVSDSQKDNYQYFLADSQGSKIIDSINGKLWTLNDYLHYLCTVKYNSVL